MDLDGGGHLVGLQPTQHFVSTEKFDALDSPPIQWLLQTASCLLQTHACQEVQS